MSPGLNLNKLIHGTLYKYCHLSHVPWVLISLIFACRSIVYTRSNYCLVTSHIAINHLHISRNIYFKCVGLQFICNFVLSKTCTCTVHVCWFLLWRLNIFVWGVGCLHLEFAVVHVFTISETTLLLWGSASCIVLLVHFRGHIIVHCRHICKKF